MCSLRHARKVLVPQTLISGAARKLHSLSGTLCLVTKFFPSTYEDVIGFDPEVLHMIIADDVDNCVDNR